MTLKLNNLNSQYGINNFFINKIIESFLSEGLIEYNSDNSIMISDIIFSDYSSYNKKLNIKTVNIDYINEGKTDIDESIYKEDINEIVNDLNLLYNGINILTDINELSSEKDTFATSFINDFRRLFFRLYNSFFNYYNNPEIDNRIAIEVLELLDSVENSISFIVGGFVRDSIIGLIPKDIDFVTNIDISILKELFINNGFNIKETGEHFQVLNVIKDGKQFEIANFRKDLEANGLGATNVEVGTFEDDFERRDFTINSLYFNPLKGILLDPNNGFEDLLNNTLRFIGKPEDRIKEDVVRIMRIYKFIKKGFIPTNKTLSAARTNFGLLCKIGNPERIRTEFEKVLF